MRTNHFSPATFRFLKDLEAHNDRAWFQANKTRYDEVVKEPALRFITDFGPFLRKISPRFRADPRPVGGSLFRIYRDVRFSKDKKPYKTHVGIHFRHENAKDAHAPGFYLHLQPGASFAGFGLWHPDGPALQRIRNALVENPKAWKRAVGAAPFRKRLRLSGDMLQRPPRGYDPDHPLLEDLKRKDFIAICDLNQKSLTGRELPKEFAALCRTGAPLVEFLCVAVGVPFS